MILYKKVGRRYIPIQEYSPENYDSLPFGHFLLSVTPTGRELQKISLEKRSAELRAAARPMRDAMLNAMLEKQKLLSGIQKELTPEQKVLVDNLLKSLHNTDIRLWAPSLSEVVEAGINALMEGVSGEDVSSNG